jgi:hypothetical protein
MEFELTVLGSVVFISKVPKRHRIATEGLKGIYLIAGSKGLYEVDILTSRVGNPTTASNRKTGDPGLISLVLTSLHPINENY